MAGKIDFFLIHMLRRGNEQLDAHCVWTEQCSVHKGKSRFRRNQAGCSLYAFPRMSVGTRVIHNILHILHLFSALAICVIPVIRCESLIFIRVIPVIRCES